MTQAKTIYNQGYKKAEKMKNGKLNIISHNGKVTATLKWRPKPGKYQIKEIKGFSKIKELVGDIHRFSAYDALKQMKERNETNE